jgi:hypothetical protein
LTFQLGAVSLKLLVCQIGYRIFVCNLELLGLKGSEDAGEGRRIFVANLFERVEALAAAIAVRLVEGIV